MHIEEENSRSSFYINTQINATIIIVFYITFMIDANYLWKHENDIKYHNLQLWKE